MIDDIILGILSNPEHDFYTPRAISRISNIPLNQIDGFLTNSPMVRTALTTTDDSQRLYTLRSNQKKLREHISEILFYFSKKYDPWN